MISLLLHDLIQTVLQEYPHEKEKPFGKNDLAKLIRNGLNNVVSNDLIGEEHESIGSAGQGNWATVPWIAFFDKNITTSAQQGFDIVYLFSPDMQRVYLSLNQGWTFFKNNFGKQAIPQIKKVANFWKNNLKNRSERMVEAPIDLQSDLIKGTNLPKGYELGNIFSICYQKNNLPNNEIMVQDLNDMINCLSELKSHLINPTDFSQSIDFILSKQNQNPSMLTTSSVEKIAKKLSSIQLNKAKEINHAFNGKKIDFQELNETNARIGFLGEKLVLEAEKRALSDFSELQRQIKHVSQEDGDGCGYDILSFDRSGNKKYIEVKTTTGDQNTPFFISENELAFSVTHAANYHLYRLFNFEKLSDSDVINYFEKKGNLKKYFNFRPVNYISSDK